MYRSGLSLGDSRPISYLGTDPRTVLLFRVGLISGAGLLAAFAWAVDFRQSRSSGFLTVFLLGMACQVIVAAVPISAAGLSHDIHVAAGILLGLSLPILMWRFAAVQVPGRWRTQCYVLMWLEVAACFGGVTLSRAGRASLAEALPACLFHLWIIVVTVRWRSLERIT